MAYQEIPICTIGTRLDQLESETVWPCAPTELPALSRCPRYVDLLSYGHLRCSGFSHCQSKMS
jgi:hypothetical protein